MGELAPNLRAATRCGPSKPDIWRSNPHRSTLRRDWSFAGNLFAVGKPPTQGTSAWAFKGVHGNSYASQVTVSKPYCDWLGSTPILRGSTPILRTLSLRLILGQRSVHVEAQAL